MNDTLSKADLVKLFDSKKDLLVSELEKWFEQEISSIDGQIESKAPSGPGGSILTVRTPIDSKRVVDTTIITEEVLGIELPPEIIKPGGYDDMEEMIADLVPKLRAVFIGDLKVKKKAFAQTVEG